MVLYSVLFTQFTLYSWFHTVYCLLTEANIHTHANKNKNAVSHAHAHAHAHANAQTTYTNNFNARYQKRPEKWHSHSNMLVCEQRSFTKSATFSPTSWPAVAMVPVHTINFYLRTIFFCQYCSPRREYGCDNGKYDQNVEIVLKIRQYFADRFMNVFWNLIFNFNGFTYFLSLTNQMTKERESFIPIKYVLPPTQILMIKIMYNQRSFTK